MLDQAEQYLRFHNWPKYPMRQNKPLIRERPRAIALWRTKRRATERLVKPTYPFNHMEQAAP